MSRYYQPKEKHKGMSFMRILTLLLILAILAVSFFGLRHITNGFSEGVKNFYVKINGNDLFASESELLIRKGQTYEFSICYLAESLVAEEDRGYNVQILSYCTKDTVFSYTLAGIKTVDWEAGYDLTHLFDLDLKDDRFTLTIPKDDMQSMDQVLQEIYPQYMVELNDHVDETSQFYQMIISSKDGRYGYKIVFSVDRPVISIECSEESICF